MFVTDRSIVQGYGKKITKKRIAMEELRNQKSQLIIKYRYSQSKQHSKITSKFALLINSQPGDEDKPQ